MDREETSARAHQEISELHWRLGIIARDEQNDPIKAAHYLFRAAQSARAAKDEARAEDLLLAAQHSAGSVDRTFVHDDVIGGAAFSPDGRSILTWRRRRGTPVDRLTRLWNAEDGRLLREFDHGAGTSVLGAVFSPDGRCVFTWAQRASPGEEGVHSWLWGVEKDQPLQEFGARFGEVEDAAFTANSSRVFVWSDERRSWAADRKGHLWLWDIEQAAVVAALENYVELPNRLGGEEPTIVYVPRPPLNDQDDFDAWRQDLKQKKQLVLELAHPEHVVGAVFNREGDRLLTWGSWADRVRLWDVEAKKLLETLPHPHQPVTGAAFNGSATQVLVWNNTTGQGGHGGWYSSVRVWDLSGYRPQPLFNVRYEQELNGAAFDPNHERILVWSDDRTARLWNLQSPELLRSIPLERPIGGAVLNANATRAFGWRFPDSQVWDLASGELVQTFEHETFRGQIGGGDSNAAGTRFLTWSANNTIGDEVELTHDEGFVWVWSVKHGRQPLTTMRHDGWVTTARFNSDASRVLSAGEDNTARLWDVETGRLVGTYQHPGHVAGAVFGPDESRILTWTGSTAVNSELDTNVRVWDKAGTLLRTFPHRSVGGAMLNANGMRLLSWGWDEVKLWDAVSGELLKTSARRVDRVLGATVRPYGPWFLGLIHPLRPGGSEFWELWRLGADQPAQALPFDDDRRSAISRDLTHGCFVRDARIAELYSTRLVSPICRLRLAATDGVFFGTDATRLLTWGSALQLWNIAPRSHAPMADQLRDHEIRTGTTLDEFGHVRVLPFEEWQKRMGRHGAAEPR